MKWMELHIDTTHAGLEAVETMLSALGIDGVVIDDEEEFQDFLENNHQYWDYVDEDLERRMQGGSGDVLFGVRGRGLFHPGAGTAGSGGPEGPPQRLRVPSFDHGHHGGIRLGEQLEAVL